MISAPVTHESNKEYIPSRRKTEVYSPPGKKWQILSPGNLGKRITQNDLADLIEFHVKSKNVINCDIGDYKTTSRHRF